MKDKISRLQALRLGAAATLGAAAGGLVGLAAQNLAPLSRSIAPTSTVGLSPENSSSENRKALVESLSGSGEHVMLEAGDYLVDNSYSDSKESEITVRDFQGKLTLLPAARIIFTDPTKRGLRFRGGTGAVIEGWNSTFQVLPTRRYNARELLAFTGTTDTLVSNCRIEGSAAAGLLFEQCVRPQVIGLSVRDTMADGLHFANCQDIRATSIITQDTGDDGVAFVNYGGRPDYRGGTGSDIRVYRSDARGISVVGQSGVSVDNFFVEDTAASGLIVAREQAYDTRVPSDVRLSNGIVKNAGSLSESETSGDGTPRDGVFLGNAGENVMINDVHVVSPRERGVHALYGDNSPRIQLSDVYIEEAGSEGVQLRDQERVSLDGVCVEGSAGVGFEFLDNDRIHYGRLLAINTGRSTPSSRAFNFERNRLIQGELLQIQASDQSSEYLGTGVNASGTHEASGEPQRGVYGRIDYLVEPPTADFFFSNSSKLTGVTQGL